MTKNHRFSRVMRFLRLNAVLAYGCGLVLVAVTMPAQSALGSPQGRNGATSQPIPSGPEYGSDADSVEIVDVTLAEGEAGRRVVQVRLRNLADEAVIGLEFDIHGSNPSSRKGHAEITQLRSETQRPVIEPLGEHVTEIPAIDFKVGDKLRLVAVLFISGRGEGDGALVDEMREDAASSTPPVPQSAPN